MSHSITKDLQLISASCSQGDTRNSQNPLNSSFLTTVDRHKPLSTANQLQLGLWAH